MKFTALISLLTLMVGCAGSLENPERFAEGTLENYYAFQAVCEGKLDTFNPGIAPTSFPVNVVIDTDITANDDIGSILDGIDAWNAAVGFEAFYATISQNLTMHGACNFVTLITNVDLPNNWIGLTNYGTCAGDTVHVETMDVPGIANPGYYTDLTVKQVTMHELGHVAGLGHEPEDATSIMFPNVGNYPLTLSRKSTCLAQQAFFRSKGFK